MGIDVYGISISGFQRKTGALQMKLAEELLLHDNYTNQHKKSLVTTKIYWTKGKENIYHNDYHFSVGIYSNYFLLIPTNSWSFDKLYQMLSRSRNCIPFQNQILILLPIIKRCKLQDTDHLKAVHKIILMYTHAWLKFPCRFYYLLVQWMARGNSVILKRGHVIALECRSLIKIPELNGKL